MMYTIDIIRIIIELCCIYLHYVSGFLLYYIPYSIFILLFI